MYIYAHVCIFPVYIYIYIYIHMYISANLRLPLDSSIELSSFYQPRNKGHLFNAAACGDGLPGFAPKVSWITSC